MNVLDLIVKAIQEKLIVTATYQNCLRIMCPHVVGYKHDKRGTATLNALFFQFSGQSNRGFPPGGQWRCIHLDELSGVKLTRGEWHTGPDHSRPQNYVDDIVAEVVI